jgi:hypothetical protein
MTREEMIAALESNSPPEGQVQAGNIDLTNRPQVYNPETKGTSSVWSMGIGTPNGQEILIPRVSDDGKILSEQEARNLYKTTGKHLGIFSNIESANAYAQKLHQDQAKQLSGPSREEMIAAMEKPEKEPTWGDRAKQGLGYALKPLDYAGGLVRTGAAGTVQGGANLMGKLKELATGEPDTTPQVVTPDDAMAALKGSAPSIGEYLKRTGMGDMGKLSDVAPILYSSDPQSLRPTPGGSFDPTVRGAVGMAGDIALDPLTYLGMGPGKALLGKAGVADHVLNPAENALKAGGIATYKSAPIMKAADALNERYTKGAASDILFDNGVRGTGRSVATQAENLAEKVGAQRNAILAQAGNQGAVLDMAKATSPAEDFINKIRSSRDPQLLPVADALEERVAQYKGLNAREAQTIPGKTVTSEIPVGTMPDSWDLATKTVTQTTPDQFLPAVRGVTPLEGSGFKTSLYNDTGNAAWDTLRRTPQGDLGNKALARGLNAETNAAVERVMPGAGAKVADLNDTWGALLTPRKAMEAEALKGEKKNFITSVDGLTAGLTHGNPIVLGAKKTTDLLKTNWLRTNAGMGAYKVGEVPLLDEILRRNLINQSQSSDWDKLRK